MSPSLRSASVLALALALGLGCGPKAPPAEREVSLVPVRSDLVYLLMVDRFADGDGWNNEFYDREDPQAFHGGDLQGVLQHIEHLDALGVGTVWLTPIFEMRDEPFDSWGAFHGYWTWNLDRVEPRFGGDVAAIELGEALRARGMGLMLDMVYNHVGMDAPLLQERPDWFHPDVSITDWDDPVQVRDGWVHGLPDLDQDHPEVRAWLVERTVHWVKTLHATGLRVDAVRHMPPDFVSQLVTEVEAQVGRPLWVVGEDFSGDPAVLAQTVSETGVDAVYDFPLRYALTDVFCGGAPVGRLASTLSLDRLYTDANAQLVGFLDNHDLPRIASECARSGHGPDDLHQALAVLLTARGTPSVSWGTELPIFGAEEPENRADYDWEQAPGLGPTIAEFAEARRVRTSLREGEDWLFHLEGDDVFAYARLTPDEVAVIVVNRRDTQVSVALPDRLRVGARQQTFHEVVGTEGPFLRHRAAEASSARPVARSPTLYPHAVMVSYLEPEVAGGFAPLLEAVRAEKAATRSVQLEVQVPTDEGEWRWVGAGPELGHWDVDAGVALTQVEPGLWRSPTVVLPPWTVAEWKVVHRTAEGDVWPEGPNQSRLLAPGAGPQSWKQEAP